MVLDQRVERSYAPGIPVHIGAAAFHLRSLLPYQNRSLLSVEEAATVEAAEALRGAEVSIDRAHVKLDPGEYLLQDLVGCDVVDDSTGRLLGEVADWQENSGQTLLAVTAASGDPLLIPLVPALCRAVQPDARIIRVALPEGLDTLNRPGSGA